MMMVEEISPKRRRKDCATFYFNTDVVDKKSKINPAERWLAFPDLAMYPPIMERIFYFLPWQLRIKLETGCKLWLRILRPKRCPLPAQPNLTLELCWFPVWEYTVAFWSRNKVFNCGNDPHLLLNTFQRLISQIPVGEVHLRGLPLSPEFLDHLGRSCIHIPKLAIMKPSIQDLPWNMFWMHLNRLEHVYVEGLPADFLEYDLLGVLDLDRIKSLHLVECSITETFLVSLSTNPKTQKLKALKFESCNGFTSEAISDLILRLASLPPLQPLPLYGGVSPIASQRNLLLKECDDVDLEELLITLGSKFRLEAVKRVQAVVRGRRIKQFVTALEDDPIFGFANHSLFACILG